MSTLNLMNSDLFPSDSEDFKGVSENPHVTDCIFFLFFFFFLFRHVERIKFLLLNKAVICHGNGCYN